MTQGALLPLFKEVDLVEQNASYVAAAKAKIIEPNMGRFYVVGAQDFTPEAGRRYDVVWCQWLVVHLQDDDMVAFLRRCAGALSPGGCIVIKENNAHDGWLFDDDDAGLMRSDFLLRRLFARAGLGVVADRLQEGFPEELHDVRMYALRPSRSVS